MGVSLTVRGLVQSPCGKINGGRGADQTDLCTLLCFAGQLSRRNRQQTAGDVAVSL